MGDAHEALVGEKSGFAYCCAGDSLESRKQAQTKAQDGVEWKPQWRLFTERRLENVSLFLQRICLCSLDFQEIRNWR